MLTPKKSLHDKHVAQAAQAEKPKKGRSIAVRARGAVKKAVDAVKEAVKGGDKPA